MEKKMRALQEARYQEELKRNKVRMAENRIKWQNDLDMQRAMREQEKKQQIEEEEKRPDESTAPDQGKKRGRKPGQIAAKARQ